jgi:predicted ATPase
MAEPGVGKSRLYFEFKATSQSGWMVLETVSVSYGKANAFLPVIDLLQSYFELAKEDDSRRRRQKILGKLLELDRALEDTVPYLYALLGIVEGDDPLAPMDGQIKKRRTLEAIKRILLRESLNQPLMVIFEDLHWIDEQTQELLNLLADSIGTAKILLLVNYRPEYSHQWNNKTYYMQLRLDPLGQESAEEMLSALLTSPAPAALAVGADRERSAADFQVGGRVRVQDDIEALKRLIIERTEGTPFFMEEIVQALFEDGVLQRNGVMKLAKPMNAVKVPATVQGVLAARIDRLPAEDKELLQTLAVLGREFPLGLVKHVTLRSDDELERGLSRLQAGEFIYEQVAAGDVEYIFKHALTQEVAHNALLVERRKQLHERAGAALESMFAGQLEEHLDELAHHYSRGEDADKAVEYLGKAGQRAAARFAYVDAISRLTEAIDLLRNLPNGPETMRRELLLQLALGPALVAVKGGWTVPEVRGTYTRARELCKRLDDPPELFAALNGLWGNTVLQGELSEANAIARQLLQLAEVSNDRALLLNGEYAIGYTSFWMGNFLRAREYFESAVSLYDEKQHRSLVFQYGFDAGINSLSFLAWSLWHLGYSDKAIERINEARLLAQKQSSPVSLAFVEAFVAAIRQSRGEVPGVKESAGKALAIADKWGLTESPLIAFALLGWAIAEDGFPEEGISLIKQGLSGIRAAGMKLASTYLVSLLADVYRKTQSPDDRQTAASELTAVTDYHQVRFWEAELFRLKGELHLSENRESAEAKRCFAFAMDVARKQSAKSLELRATMSLARLLASEGRRDQARTMLAEIYNWFTEGFDTTDLKDAKALLDDLAT